jgi:hypothetical protein
VVRAAEIGPIERSGPLGRGHRDQSNQQ